MKTLSNLLIYAAILVLLGGAFTVEALGRQLPDVHYAVGSGGSGTACTVEEPCTITQAINNTTSGEDTVAVRVRRIGARAVVVDYLDFSGKAVNFAVFNERYGSAANQFIVNGELELRGTIELANNEAIVFGPYVSNSRLLISASSIVIAGFTLAPDDDDPSDFEEFRAASSFRGNIVIGRDATISFGDNNICPTFENLQIASGAAVEVSGSCTPGLSDDYFVGSDGAYGLENTSGIQVWNVLDVDGSLTLDSDLDLHLVAPRPNSKADSADAGVSSSTWPRAEIAGMVTSSGGLGSKLYIQVQEERLTDTTLVRTLIAPTYLGWLNGFIHAYQITGSGRIDMDVIKTTQAGVRLDVDFGSGARSENRGGVLYVGASNINGYFENNGFAQTEFRKRVVISNSVVVNGPDTTGTRKGIGSVTELGLDEDGNEDNTRPNPVPMLECYDHSDRLQGSHNRLRFTRTADGFEATETFPRMLGSRALTGGIYFRGRGSLVSGVVELNAGIKRAGTYNHPGKGTWNHGDDVEEIPFACYGGIYFLAATSVSGSVIGDAVTHLGIRDGDVTIYGPGFDVRSADELVVTQIGKDASISRGSICGNASRARGAHLVFAGSNSPQTIVGSGKSLDLQGIGIRVDKETGGRVDFSGVTVSTRSVDIKGGLLFTHGMLDVHEGYLFINQSRGSVGDLRRGTGKNVYAIVDKDKGTMGEPDFIVYTGNLASMDTGDELYEGMEVDMFEMRLATATTKLTILNNISVGDELRLWRGTLEIPSGISVKAPMTLEVGNGYVDEDGTGTWSLADNVRITFAGKAPRETSNILPAYAALEVAKGAETASIVSLVGCPAGLTLSLQEGHTPVGELVINNGTKLDLAGNVLVAIDSLTVKTGGWLCDSHGDAPCTAKGEAHQDLLELSGALEAVHFADSPERRLDLARARATFAASRGSEETAPDSGGAVYFYNRPDTLDTFYNRTDTTDTIAVFLGAPQASQFMPTVKVGEYTRVWFWGGATPSTTTTLEVPNKADKVVFPSLVLMPGEKAGSGGHVEFKGFDHVMIGDDATFGGFTKFTLHAQGGHPQSTFMVGGDFSVGGTIAVNGNVLAVVGDYNQGTSIRPQSDVWLQQGTHYMMGDFYVGEGFHPDTTHIYALQAANTGGDHGDVCGSGFRDIGDRKVRSGLWLSGGDYTHYGAGDAFDANQGDVLGLRGTVTFAGNDTSRVAHSGGKNSFCHMVVMSDTAGLPGMVMMGSDVLQNIYGELTLRRGVIGSDNDDFSWVLANEAIEDTLVGRLSIGADESGVVRYGSRDSYVDGFVSRSVSKGNQSGGVVTGGYLFPVGNANETGPDYYRPLIMQFPADLGTTRIATVGFMAGAVANSMDWPDQNLVVDGADGSMLTLDNVADMFWKVKLDAVPAHDPNIRVAADELHNIFDIDGLRIVQWDCDGTNPRLAGVYDLDDSDESGNDDKSFVVNDFVNGIPNLTQEGVNVGTCNIFGIAGNFLENPISVPPITGGTSRVQFIHNVAGATVDLYIDDNKVVDDFAFQTARAFGTIAAGDHNMDIVAANAPDNSVPLVSLPVRFRRGMNYHVIAHGNLGAGVMDFVIREDVRMASTTNNMVDFYFVHGAAGLGEVDIRIIDPIDNTRVIDLLANNFKFDDVGTYMSMNPGGYNFEVTTANNDTQIDVFRLEIQQYANLAFVLNLSGAGKSSAEGVTMMGVAQDGNPFFPQVITGTETSELPTEFALLGNYPNPFNPSTRIEFDLPETAEVSIAVFDILGRNVMALPSKEFEAGASRSIELNAANLASGNYFYRVVATGASGRHIETGRMVLIK